eukprot:7385715-Prymnesium_polylepis.1
MTWLSAGWSPKQLNLVVGEHPPKLIGERGAFSHSCQLEFGVKWQQWTPRCAVQCSMVLWSRSRIARCVARKTPEFIVRHRPLLELLEAAGAVEASQPPSDNVRGDVRVRRSTHPDLTR